MTRTTFVTEKPVVLEGFQAVFKPSKYGYSLTAIVSQDIVDKLEEDRIESLKWVESKLKNPKRSTLRPEPWEEVANEKYKVKFAWDDKKKPPIVDTEGTHVIDERTPLFSGSTVKLAFFQKPYILKDGVTYGTALKLRGVQIVSLNSEAGVDVGDMNVEDVSALFGKTQGYKQEDPNVVESPGSCASEEDSFDF